MRDLCIVAWVYGTKYQGWIPLYIYSILKNYPKYSVRIYVDRILRPKIKQQLRCLRRMGDFTIVENVNQKYASNLSDIEKRCYRWLLSDYYLWKNYKYVYIGDIDIYIENEDISLLEQHIKHMKENGLLYSNEQRLTIKDYVFKNFAPNKQHLFRLTGLHFIQTRPYYNKVRIQQKLLRFFLNLPVNSVMGFIFKPIKKIFFNDDERCLWLLVKISGIKMPRCSYELSNNKKCCRPLHGYHFAIGREKIAYKKILSDKNKFLEHERYYKNFVKEYNDDCILREYVKMSDIYIQNIIKKNCEFWGYKMEENYIEKEKDML